MAKCKSKKTFGVGSNRSTTGKKKVIYYREGAAGSKSHDALDAEFPDVCKLLGIGEFDLTVNGNTDDQTTNEAQIKALLDQHGENGTEVVVVRCLGWINPDTGKH